MPLYSITQGTKGGSWDLMQAIQALTGTNDVGAISAFAPINPPGAPSVAVNTAAGNLTGNYQYAVAFLTGYVQGQSVAQGGTLYSQGNTGGGTASATVSPSAQQVNLSTIPVGPTGTVARVLYRTKAGGSSFFVLAQLNDNTTTSYTDNTTDANLGAAMPTTNTTGSYFAGAATGITNLTASGAVNFNGGTVTLGNATSNTVSFFNAGVAPPNATMNSAGTKLALYGSTAHGIGVDANTLWYSTDNYHKWYTQNGGTGTPAVAMTLDGIGNLTTVGDIISSGSMPNGFVIDTDFTSPWSRGLVIQNAGNSANKFYLGAGGSGASGSITNAVVQFGSKTVMEWQPSGEVQTSNNTLDDGSGILATAKQVVVNGGNIVGNRAYLVLNDTNTGTNIQGGTVRFEGNGAAYWEIHSMAASPGTNTPASDYLGFWNNGSSFDALQLYGNGEVLTRNNTLDDGSGNVIIRAGRGVQVNNREFDVYETTSDQGLFINNGNSGFYDWKNNRQVLWYTQSSGTLATTHNTLDDGSGNTTINGGTLTLGNGTSNLISFAPHGYAEPTASGGAGMKILLDNEPTKLFALGVGPANDLWYSSATTHKWFTQNDASSATPTVAMTLDGSGDLTVTNNIHAIQMQLEQVGGNAPAVNYFNSSGSIVGSTFYDNTNELLVFRNQQTGTVHDLTMDANGKLYTSKNTLDDGSGNATFANTVNAIQVGATNIIQNRVSPNMIINSGFEDVTTTATVFSDALTSYSGSTVPAPWTLQSGSFTFGASGATSGSGYSAMTAGTAVWKPIVGSDGTTKLAVKAQATFTEGTTVGAQYVYLWVDTNNNYFAKIDSTNFQLWKTVSGNVTQLKTSAPATSVSSTDTMTLQLDNTGLLTATFTPSGGSTTTLTATDTSLTGGFLIGVGGDTGVVISQASCVAPWANSWTIGGDSRVAWGLTQSAIGGKYSVSAVGLHGFAGKVQSSNMSVNASTTYTLSSYQNGSNVGTSGAQIKLTWFNGSTFISDVGPSVMTGTTSTERTSITSASPSNATVAQAIYYVYDSGTVTFDNIQLEQGSTATPYIPMETQYVYTGLNVEGNQTVNGGTLTLGNGASNQLVFSSYGVSSPTANGGPGMKLNLYGGEFGIGVETAAQWYTSNGKHKWYTQNGGSGTPTVAMTLDGSGSLTTTGGLGSQHNILDDGTGSASFAGTISTPVLGIGHGTEIYPLNSSNVVDISYRSNDQTTTSNFVNTTIYNGKGVTALRVDGATFAVTTNKNTLDDGSGMVTLAGKLNIAGSSTSPIVTAIQGAGNYMDNYLTLYQVSSASVWGIQNADSGGTKHSVFNVFGYGSTTPNKVSTINNTLDDGYGNATFTGDIRESTYSMSASTADSNGKYTVVTYNRVGSTTTKYMVSTLSNGPDANGNYGTMTNVYYKADGTTTDHTETYTMTYDANGVMTGRTVAIS